MPCTQGCVNSLIYGYTGNAGITLKAAALRTLHKAGLCLHVEVPDEPMAIEGEEVCSCYSCHVVTLALRLDPSQNSHTMSLLSVFSIVQAPGAEASDDAEAAPGQVVITDSGSDQR